jgi:putative transposase
MREIDWVVYAKEPFAGPEEVLRYLSRYTHRVAISNRRLVHQEAPDELVGRQRHRLVPSRPLDPIVLVLEGDAFLVDGRAARERQPSRKHCARSQAARDAAERPNISKTAEGRRAVRAAASMPVLRRPHDPYHLEAGNRLSYDCVTLVGMFGLGPHGVRPEPTDSGVSSGK